MRKYLYIFKSEVMSNLQYITNILFNTIAYIIHIFIFFNLWNYIYDDPSQIINGYSKNQMIWYVIITEILWSATEGRKFCRKICDDVRGYSFNQILLLWGMAASTYGFAHFFFKRSFSLSDTITNGKLDNYLVQPKNVLLASITSDVEVSALGDMLYGLIMLCISGFTIEKLFLFALFTICGGIVIVDIAVILASLSFWFGRADMIADTGNGLMINFATYPDGIFKGITKVLLFTLIPIGITTYIPIWVMTKFNLNFTILIILVSIIVTVITFIVFYKGLHKYSSSNLMISKI